jgi:hypothetical protein
VLACFGSPPERIWRGLNKTVPGAGESPQPLSPHPAAAACDCITELLRQSSRLWYFGVDWGECAFSWSEETGYTANGRPVVRARWLASLVPRCRAQVIITGQVREKINQAARNLNIPGRDPSGAELYELLISK